MTVNEQMISNIGKKCKVLMGDGTFRYFIIIAVTEKSYVCRTEFGNYARFGESEVEIVND